SIEDAIKREIKEETGLEIKVKEIKNVKSVFNPKEFREPDVHFVLIDVIAQSNTDKVILDEEHVEYKWVDPKEALKMDLLTYSREPIEKYLSDLSNRDYLEGWKRCKADYENYKRKTAQEMKQGEENARNEIILSILPILDNFNLAIDHVPKEDQAKPWVEGIFYIKKQFEDLLENLGIQEVDSLHQEFDPNKHECIEEIKVKEKEKKGKVVQVLSRGYRFKDKIIRAAKVKVGK
ncbi:MAG: nucleotide exchange factor GrpE, partial [Candidatus Moranbacteria bacterium]|nr:nucleotide exchange factor GrpE [Candidatus Moranbacteria bacterium]